MGLFESLLKVKYNDNEKTDTIDIIEKNVQVTEDNIYNISSVGNAINTISGLIATLPIDLYKNSKGVNTKIIDDKRLIIANKEANILITSTELKKLWVKDFILHGGYYGLIKRNGNDIESIDYVHPNNIYFEKKYGKDGALADIKVSVTIDSNQFEPSIFDVIYTTQNSLDGLKGKGILENNKLALETALNEIVKYKNSISEGYSQKGILSMNSMKRETFDKFKQDLLQQYSGLRGSNLTIANGLSDLKFIPTNLSPNELEVIKARKLSDDLGKNILGDVNGDLQDLYNKVLIYYIESIESSLDKALLLEEEKEQGYYFKFDTSQLLRGDLKGLMQTIKTGIDAGVLSINQAKEMLDLEPLDKDFYRHSLGNVLITEDGEIKIFNTGEKDHV